MMVQLQKLYENICDAHKRISSNIVKTPIVKSDKFSETYKGFLHLKMEHQQRTGSFKLRGAHSKLSLISQKQERNGLWDVTSYMVIFIH